MSDKRKRIEDLEARIADLETRLPKHSVPPAMLIQLEDMEQDLEEARREAETEEADDHRDL